MPAVSRVLECRRVRAPSDIARLLDLRAGDPLAFVRRVLTFDGRPVVLDDIWLPGAVFKGLTAERLAEYRGPLYGLFETEFGTRMIRAAERIRAVAAEAEAARLLQVAAGDPLLLVERVSLHLRRARGRGAPRPQRHHASPLPQHAHLILSAPSNRSKYKVTPRATSR